MKMVVRERREPMGGVTGGPAAGAVRKRRVRQPLDPKTMKEYVAAMAESYADMAEMAAQLLERHRFFDVPASSKAIIALPVLRAGDTAEQVCALCRQSFKKDDTLRMMPCSHSFHQSCIFQMLRANNTCPCCRFAMPVADGY